jgi:hypothetical protein
MVGDRDPVGVAPEIIQGARGSIEGRLAVDDPVVVSKRRAQALKVSESRIDVEPGFLGSGFTERVQELPAE